MIHAYSKYYANRAMVVLGSFLDIGVNVLNKDIEELWGLFISSGYADRFERGDIGVVAGKTGTEIACELCNVEYEFSRKYFVGYFEEYWTGWALAYYQWYMNIGFSYIFEKITITDILLMFNPYHEMDLSKFVERMNEMLGVNKLPTKLKRMRQERKMTQKTLSVLAELPIRTLQQYEQRQKSINKASAETVFMLARALGCEIQDILE